MDYLLNAKLQKMIDGSGWKIPTLFARTYYINSSKKCKDFLSKAKLHENLKDPLEDPGWTRRRSY